MASNSGVGLPFATQKDVPNQLGVFTRFNSPVSPDFLNSAWVCFTGFTVLAPFFATSPVVFFTFSGFATSLRINSGSDSPNR